MIEFEIIKSPDEDIIEKFKFYKNEIILGKKSRDLSIDDKSLRNHHLHLYVQKNDLYVLALEGVDFFLVNGKRSTGTKKIKINDQIHFGETTLSVLNFETTEKISKKEILTTKMNQFIEEDSLLLISIEKLTQLMK
jgi:hypothetical protein